MKLAGICFILIVVIVYLQYNTFNDFTVYNYDYQNPDTNPLQVLNSTINSFQKKIENLKSLFFLQMALLLVAGISLLVTGMSEREDLVKNIIKEEAEKKISKSLAHKKEVYQNIYGGDE